MSVENKAHSLSYLCLLASKAYSLPSSYLLESQTQQDALFVTALALTILLLEVTQAGMLLLDADEEWMSIINQAYSYMKLGEDHFFIFRLFNRTGLHAAA